MDISNIDFTIMEGYDILDLDDDLVEEAKVGAKGVDPDLADDVVASEALPLINNELFVNELIVNNNPPTPNQRMYLSKMYLKSMINKISSYFIYSLCLFVYNLHLAVVFHQVLGISSPWDFFALYSL